MIQEEGRSGEIIEPDQGCHPSPRLLYIVIRHVISLQHQSTVAKGRVPKHNMNHKENRIFYPNVLLFYCAHMLVRLVSCGELEKTILWKPWRAWSIIPLVTGYNGCCSNRVILDHIDGRTGTRNYLTLFNGLTLSCSGFLIALMIAGRSNFRHATKLKENNALCRVKFWRSIVHAYEKYRDVLWLCMHDPCSLQHWS